VDGTADLQALKPAVSPSASEPAATYTTAGKPAGAPAQAVKPPYPPPAEHPTQTGPGGIAFDFNEGCRVLVPEADKPWRVRLSDLDTGNILFQSSTDFAAGRVRSAKRCRVGGGALDCSHADLRPPLKLDVQFSRIQLS
jgi:hypothetical protein